MDRLTPRGEQRVMELAQQYQVSTDAVRTLLWAVINGGGTMAQFNHPDLGGSGQWMAGGMTMVGDMFNNGLKAQVDGLCSALARDLNGPALVEPSAPAGGFGGGFGGNNWWPAELGQPSMSGAQNGMRYAYFPQARRLAVEGNGGVTVYDTQDHQLGGVSQQQGWGSTLTFSSQFGTVAPEQLPKVSGSGQQQAMAGGHSHQQQASYNNQQQAPAPFTPEAPPPPTPPGAPMDAPGGTSEGDIFAKIERLAQLKERGILSDEEFATKKSELLSRI